MIVAILQARCSSSRLPGKVLAPVLGRPMLARQLDRLRLARSIARLIVATSMDRSDDEIERLCGEEAVECFRGSLDDVLDRFHQAAKYAHADHVVRLTGDCPLADPELIDRVVAFYLGDKFDYASNTLEPTFPDGLDVEVFGFGCLETAAKEARLPSHREHVTPFIYSQPERFRLGNFKSSWDLSHLRWTVDEAADLELVKTIYQELYPTNSGFSTNDILRLLEKRPELRAVNSRFGRNAGLERSLAKDREFLKKKLE